MKLNLSTAIETSVNCFDLLINEMTCLRVLLGTPNTMVTLLTFSLAKYSENDYQTQ